MSEPFPFTRENVLSWLGNVLTGAVAGSIMVAAVFLIVEVVA
jgi:hypothetical protein